MHYQKVELHMPNTPVIKSYISRFFDVYLELLFWSISAIIFAALPLLHLSRGLTFYEVIDKHYFAMVFAILIVLFPIVFEMVFSETPFQYIRSKLTKVEKAVSVNVGGNYINNSTTITPTVKERGTSTISADRFGSANPFMLEYADRSRDLAEKIYTRSGVYLLFGVLISFSGLIFFYSQTVQIDPTADTNSTLIRIAPKFGILFFIELVAFFFLRQYRSAMDEFRYYEGIARTREEVSALFEYAKESGTTVKTMELKKSSAYFSKMSTLQKGETTDLIETRKMDKNESDLLGKIVETVANTKK